MSYFPRDFALEVARGRIRKHFPVHKFGHAPTGVQTTQTDIWDRADATPTQSLWTAPTQARIHNIVSSSANDADGNTGAREVKIWGLTSWDAATYPSTGNPYTTETITLDGATPVPTTNSYVIIHRMRVTTAGTGGVNAGTITATAATDGTITAAILPGNGSTQMAIMGIPANWQHFIFTWQASLNKASGAAAAVQMYAWDDDYADPTLPVSNIRDEFGVQSTGSNAFIQINEFPLRFSGPCIIRVSATSSVADADVTATWNGVTVPDSGFRG